MYSNLPYTPLTVKNLLNNIQGNNHRCWSLNSIIKKKKYTIPTWIDSIRVFSVLAYSPEELQFVLDIRSADRDQNAIWVVSSRLHRYFKKTLDKREVNIRIMRIVREPELLPYAFNNNNSLLLFKWSAVIILDTAPTRR